MSHDVAAMLWVTVGWCSCWWDAATAKACGPVTCAVAGQRAGIDVTGRQSENGGPAGRA